MRNYKESRNFKKSIEYNMQNDRLRKKEVIKEDEIEKKFDKKETIKEEIEKEKPKEIKNNLLFEQQIKISPRPLLRLLAEKIALIELRYRTETVKISVEKSRLVEKLSIFRKYFEIIKRRLTRFTLVYLLKFLPENQKKTIKEQLKMKIR